MKYKDLNQILRFEQSLSPQEKKNKLILNKGKDIFSNLMGFQWEIKKYNDNCNSQVLKAGEDSPTL